MIKNMFGKKNPSDLQSGYYSLHQTRLEKQLAQARSKVRQQSRALLLLAISFGSIAVSQWWFLSSKTRDLVVLHDSGNGSAWITQQRGVPTPSEAATRSNIARYVRMRESYAATSFAFQYRLINQLSGPQVALAFRRAQSANQKSSLLRQYGRTGLRKVTVDDIVLLPFKKVRGSKTLANQNPFAEVHFTTVDMPNGSHRPKITNHTALLSWRYEGIPSDPDERLNNWMGFKVHYYEVTNRQKSR